MENYIHVWLFPRCCSRLINSRLASLINTQHGKYIILSIFHAECWSRKPTGYWSTDYSIRATAKHECNSYFKYFKIVNMYIVTRNVYFVMYSFIFMFAFMMVMLSTFFADWPGKLPSCWSYDWRLEETI